VDPVAQSVYRLAKGWTVRGLNPVYVQLSPKVVLVALTAGLVWEVEAIERE
jgi:hypothetical protein